MPHRVRISAPNGALAARIKEWLDDSRVCLPAPVSIDIRIEPIAESAPDARTKFGDSIIDIRSGPPANNVTIEWLPRFGRAILEPGGTSVTAFLSEEALAQPFDAVQLFLFDVCVLLMRRVGLHHVHAAALRDPRGRGWCIIGASGSGKSTTTSLLAKLGWSVGTDDISFMTAGSKGLTDLVAWRERVGLLPDSASAIRQSGGVPVGSRRKSGWFAEELGAPWVDRVTPEVLVFPTASADLATSVRPLRAKEAMSRLMHSSQWVSLDGDLADEHLGLMTRLATQARAFDATVGRDLFDRPEILAELIS